MWGVLVGLGRLYYGEHNTLDVICGAALGTIFAIFVWLVFINRWVGDGPPTSADDDVSADSHPALSRPEPLATTVPKNSPTEEVTTWPPSPRPPTASGSN